MYYQIQQNLRPPTVNVMLPERELGTSLRAIPLAEHWVLIGQYENIATLRWIVREKKYVFQLEPLVVLNACFLKLLKYETYYSVEVIIKHFLAYGE